MPKRSVSAWSVLCISDTCPALWLTGEARSVICTTRVLLANLTPVWLPLSLKSKTTLNLFKQQANKSCKKKPLLSSKKNLNHPYDEIHTCSRHESHGSSRSTWVKVVSCIYAYLYILYLAPMMLTCKKVLRPLVVKGGLYVWDMNRWDKQHVTRWARTNITGWGRVQAWGELSLNRGRGQDWRGSTEDSFYIDVYKGFIMTLSLL